MKKLVAIGERIHDAVYVLWLRWKNRRVFKARKKDPFIY